MLRRIEIENYKSITKLPVELGRYNVFIGENGAGKSNILEAIALASAAASGKLDNEFLAARGIRVTRPELMRAGFFDSSHSTPITVSITHQSDETVDFEISNDNQPYSKWQSAVSHRGVKPSLDVFTKTLADWTAEETTSGRKKSSFSEDISLAIDNVLNFAKNSRSDLISIGGDGIAATSSANELGVLETKILDLIRISILKQSFLTNSFKDFLIFSPENSALRAFEREGQIEPLGINGEGLLKLIHVHSTMEDNTAIEKMKRALRMLGWFEDFMPSSEITDERLIIRDKYLEKLPFDLDQKSANEGFLFLLFYFALFTSKLTPQFFAIDNIDASLNPKLCQKLTTELVRLSKANDKQAIVTTHNPAVLDGLNLDDDEQRLFVVSRGRDGATKLKRIHKPASDGPSYRLSELFLRGLLGGLPKGF